MSARATILLALGLAACGQQGHSQVHLDFTSVSQAAILAAGDTLTVRARGPGFEQSVAVDLTTPTFSMDVPSGSLLLEAEADHLNASGVMTPYYFGDARVAVAPDTTTDVLLPMFPAGAISLTVLFKPDFVIPGRILITLTPTAPRADESPSFDASLVDGKLYRVLPDGDYTYRVRLSTDGGQTFEAVGPTSSVITIVQSQVFAPPPFDLTNVKF